MQKRSQKLVIGISVAALILAVFPQFAGKANASSLPQFGTVVVRLDNDTSAAYSGGSVCIATPAVTSGVTGFGTENYVDIGFPDTDGVTSGQDFQVQDTTLTNWITSTTPPASPGTGSAYWPTINIGGTGVAPAGWPSIGTNAVAATNGSYTLGDPQTLKVVRFATGNLTADKTYCFDFRSGTNWPGSAETSSTYALQVSHVGTNGYIEDVPGYVETYHCSSGCSAVGAGQGIESSNWGTQVSANNQIVVSAVVPPIFEMDFASNIDSFPTNLNPNSVTTTTGNTVVVKTNAKGGWFVWTKSANQALTSVSSGGSIPSVGWGSTPDTPTALVAGTPGYNLTVGVTANVNGAGTTKCTPAVTAEYAGVLTSFQGGELTPNWEMAATCSTVTPPGTDGGTDVTFNENAAISFSTPAASDYTDTIYVTGAGQF